MGRSGRRIALESGAGGYWWGGWVQSAEAARTHARTYLAATYEGYGEGDKFWISGLRPKREAEE